jgi:hypothetical protein
MKLYRLRVLQALSFSDKHDQLFIHVDFVNMIPDDKNSCLRCFGDKAMFHVSVKADTRSCCVWGLRNIMASDKLHGDSPRVIVFCALLAQKVYGPFVAENTITGDS